MTSTHVNQPADINTLLHQTTIALSQVRALLQQTTDILANLHTYFLHHTGQANSLQPQPFTHLPRPHNASIILPSPTSSCDSAPLAPRVRPAKAPTRDSEDTPTPPPSPPAKPARKRKEPPTNPIHTSTTDWDAWDADADCRLVELKSNPKLRPNWKFVARRVGFSVEQCKARWTELQDLQKLQDLKPSDNPPTIADTTKPTPPDPAAPHTTPTPTSPANTPPLPSQPDFSATPVSNPTTPPADVLLPPAAERAPTENGQLDSTPDLPVGYGCPKSMFLRTV